MSTSAVVYSALPVCQLLVRGIYDLYIDNISWPSSHFMVQRGTLRWQWRQDAISISICSISIYPSFARNSIIS